MYVYKFKQKCRQFWLCEIIKGVFSIFSWSIYSVLLTVLFGIVSFSISHYSQLFYYVRVIPWSPFETEVSLGAGTVLAARS